MSRWRWLIGVVLLAITAAGPFRTSDPHLIVPAGHQSAVEMVRLDSSGQRAASLDRDGTLILWNLAIGREVSRFTAVDKQGMDISGDLRLMAMLLGEDTLALTSLPDGRQVAAVALPLSHAWGVRLLPDASAAIVATPITLLEISFRQSGAPVTLLRDTSQIVDVAVSPNGRWIASASGSGAIWLVDRRDTGSAQLVYRRARSEPRIWDNLWDLVSVAANGRIAIGDGDSCVVVDSTGAVLASLSRRLSEEEIRDRTEQRPSWSTQPFDIHQVHFSNGGDSVLIVHGDGAIRTWDIKRRGTVGYALLDNDDEANAIDVARDGRLILAGHDTTVRLWNANTGYTVRKLASRIEPAGALKFCARTTIVLSNNEPWQLTTGAPTTESRCRSRSDAVAYSANREYVLTGATGFLTDTGSWAVRRTSTRDTVMKARRLARGSGRISLAAVSEDGRWAALRLSGRRVRDSLFVWEGDAPEPSARLGLPDVLGREQLTFATRGDALLYVTDGLAVLYNIPAGTADTVRRRRDFESEAVITLDGERTILLGTDRGFLMWYDGTTGRLRDSVRVSSRGIDALASSDDGRVIAMMNDVGEVSVAAAEDIKVLATYRSLPGTRGITRHIALTPSGTALVTSGVEGSIHVWSTRSGEELFARYEFLPTTNSDESWALITNDGQYDGSPAGIAQLYFADGWDVIPPPVRPTSGLAARRLIP